MESFIKGSHKKLKNMWGDYRPDWGGDYSRGDQCREGLGNTVRGLRSTCRFVHPNFGVKSPIGGAPSGQIYNLVLQTAQKT